MKFKFFLGCLMIFNTLTILPSTFLNAALNPSAPTPHFAKISKNSQRALELMTQQPSYITIENAKIVTKYIAPFAAIALLIKHPAIAQYAFDKTIQATNASYKAAINSAIYVKNELPKIFQARQPQDYPANQDQPQDQPQDPDLVRRQRLANNDNRTYFLVATGAFATLIGLNHFIREQNSLIHHIKKHGLQGIVPAIKDQFIAVGNYVKDIFEPVQ